MRILFLLIFRFVRMAKVFACVSELRISCFCSFATASAASKTLDQSPANSLLCGPAHKDGTIENVRKTTVICAFTAFLPTPFLHLADRLVRKISADECKVYFVLRGGWSRYGRAPRHISAKSRSISASVV